MVKVRQDAWSHEDDLLLAETVLRHIREGSTQLNAFEEVGDKLNRTSAACGFRWNAEVRQRYEQAVSIAKRQRKEKKRAQARQEKTVHTSVPVPARKAMMPDVRMLEQELENDVEYGQDFYEDLEPIASTNTTMQSSYSELNLDNVIDYLKTMKKEYNESNKSKTSLEKMKKENEHLISENEKLEKKVLQLEQQLTTVQEDYQVLIQIMDRARKMVVFDEDDSAKTPAFRMEKNGNLEQVAR
ncbi:RsfA family transcriptional regulator [Aquibacillus koreensis]|uniref:RsfA family transcriptional regulator n=1 Tax=Aquibacillus koreensis TaxID=279446 RepID=A0A9X3WIR3_9BACI|nr:RsfA family transcriptional regulator [Aquibacillus koreensis]MCT2537660.1 RsfA family transcriptional regulator [Aquibacillus koreensis]MDC3419106.1 RsfA family transcriptional regulator [Aquibacillus koreensis]